MEKLKIPYTIIVEGRYDKLRLELICDARILTTDGFGIFKKNEKLALFRKLSEKMPLILLTDSDGAGKLIRSHITSAIPRDRIIQLYTPEIMGKEKRKKEFSAEGKLGVEGMEATLLHDLLKPYESEEAYEGYLENPLSKADFFRDGLMGGKESAKKRDELAKKLGLPSGMTSNALLATLKIIISYEEYLFLVGRQ
ncbi:MAG: DUF4093 domain-containing protein [Ruminococcaceae bacterium]|nr:DUF4093 domain-containing protein [Oscillospiraceae bacterium]